MTFALTVLIAVAGVAEAGDSGAAPNGATPASSRIERASFDSRSLADASTLLRLNRRMDRFGPRPTATANHRRFVAWIERRIRKLPGIGVRSVPVEIKRQIERRPRLEAGPNGRRLRRVAVSSPIPYAKPTGRRGIAAPLVYVLPGESIGERDVAGRIVIRDAVPGSVPRAVFLGLAWFLHDPDLSLAGESLENYERDWVNFTRNLELEEAAEAGAAGLVFVHGFPRSQVRGHYAPYNGVFWDIPGVYVGVDEGERLKGVAERGGRARLSLRATRKRARTRTLIATLPGMSEERIAITSHTDGINAVWDNGPIAMLAMAEHFSSLPREARPRTLQFAFTTAHLYLTKGSAETYAAELDALYDEGEVAFAMALEHLGAREYAAVPRSGGKPGQRIEPTGRDEVNSFFVGESPVLAAAAAGAIVGNDLRRSIVLRGADLPGLHLPLHLSMGGEGGAYHNHLIPTIAFVTGSWPLFNPAFGIEAIDGDLFREQLVVFSDLVHSLAGLPSEAIAGGYLAERVGRAVLCGLADDGLGVVRCPE